jgi:hypothetical protein
MRRGLLATLFIIHGLLHASIGVWAVAGHSLAMVNTLWSVAILAYVATGLAILRVPVLRNNWKSSLLTASGASLLLLVFYGGTLGLLGLGVNLVLAFLAFDVMQPRVDNAVETAERVHVAGLPHPWWHRVGWGFSVVVLLYIAAVVFIRPIYLGWGTTAAERIAMLPGDDAVAEARYRVDHGITIRAPADSVWPWLAQLGQNRGGFYSYARLERMFGDRITNADRIHPEWQNIAVGDTVFATQADYLGGRFGHLGWKVTHVVPGRVLVLENWGSFVLQPVDSATTRLFIRTRGPGRSSVLGLVLGPLNVFVFEPAHFIMQRGMLHGIRDRAEGRVRGGV